MSGIRSGQIRATRLVALAIALALAVVGGAVTIVALAVPAAAPALILTPAEGPAGTQVSAVATGFEDCPLAGYDDVGDPEVAFTWVEEEKEYDLATVPLSSGVAKASFPVPTAAALQPHTVVVRCLGDTKLVARATFLVTPLTQPPTIVPDLLGATLDEAAARLKEAGLVLGQTLGSGEEVVSQEPLAGTEVAVESPVDVTLGVTEPEFVDVPDVTGLTVDEARESLADARLEVGAVSGTGERVGEQSPAPGSKALPGALVDLTLRPELPTTVVVPDLVGQPVTDVPNILAGAGLELGTVTGEGATVRRQTPAPGDRVPRGSIVNVSVEAVVEPQTLTPVPDLVGMSREEALTVLERSGLRLAVTSTDGTTIDTQHPEAGTMVPVGSTIAVTTSPSMQWLVIVLMVLAAAALVGLAAVGVKRLVKPPRGPGDRTRGPSAHSIRAEPVPSGELSATIAEAPGEGEGARHVVRIEPHPGERQHELQEVGP